LDEVFVKVNGKISYLWRAVGHEGEVLEAVATMKRDKAAALKLLKRIMKKYGALCSIVTDGLRAYSAAMNEIRVAAERHEVGGRLNNRAENSHQPFRRRERAVQRFSKCEDAAEIQLSSCPGAQPIQSGAPSRHEASLQAETLCCLGRVAFPRGIDRRSRDGGRAACRRTSVTLTLPVKVMIRSSRSFQRFCSIAYQAQCDDAVTTNFQCRNQ
jgi:IS1 family transposase